MLSYGGEFPELVSNQDAKDPGGTPPNNRVGYFTIADESGS